MPKEITHIHIAELIRDALPEKLAHTLNQHSHTYQFGSMSPDMYYYDITLPFEKKPDLEYGEYIHGRYGNDNSVHVLWMIEQTRKIRLDRPAEADARLAFLCGYLTHVAADVIFHPYIYSVSGNYYDPDPEKRKQAEIRHRMFETCLDFYILGLRGQTLDEFGLLDRIRLDRNWKNPILEFYGTSLKEHGAGDEVTRFSKRAFHKSRMIIRMFQSAFVGGLLVRLNRPLNGKLSIFSNLCYGKHTMKGKIDYANLEPAVHPVTAEPYDGRLPVLLKKSVTLGQKLCEAAWLRVKDEISEKQAGKVLKPYSLNNGLVCTPNEDMIYYDLREELNTI